MPVSLSYPSPAPAGRGPGNSTRATGCRQRLQLPRRPPSGHRRAVSARGRAALRLRPAPSAKLPLGSVEANGRGPNGDYLFLVTMTPAEAGMSTQMLQLSAEPGAVLIEVPVILKADAK